MGDQVKFGKVLYVMLSNINFILEGNLKRNYLSQHLGQKLYMYHFTESSNAIMKYSIPSKQTKKMKFKKYINLAQVTQIISDRPRTGMSDSNAE